MESIFLIIGVALIAASFFGYISNAMRQPLILAYIITGFILGPGVLGLVHDVEAVTLLSEMGITFLLFTVGLHLSPKNLKGMGAVSLFTGLGQVILITLAGYYVGVGFGFDSVSSFIMGLCMAFSSTIVIVKLLNEKKEINSLHGRISVGFLIVQDFLAVAALVLLPSLGTEASYLVLFSETIIKDIIFMLGIWLFTKFLLESLFDSIAKNQELLFLSSISYCFLLAMVSQFLGLSIEIGAFLAGVSLATLPYNLQIESKIGPLRDFFVVIFFITLGAQLGFSFHRSMMMPMIIYSLLVVVATPIMLMTIMGFLGYRKRTSFLVGLTVAQISEFSLILAALAYKQGIISSEATSIITGVGVVTITLSAYMIIFGHGLYYKFSKYLSVFERKNPMMEMTAIPEETLNGKHIIIVGYHRIGYGIVKKLLNMKKDVVVVDFDPQIVKHLMQKKIPCIYGDIGDPDILDSINLKEAYMVISTSADTEDNLKLMKKAKKVNPHVLVMITAEQVEEALELYEEGADYVILPHLLGGNHASLLLEDISTDVDKLVETKVAHLEELKERKSVHPHHNRK